MEELVSRIGDSIRLNEKLTVELELPLKSPDFAWRVFDGFFENIMFMYDVEVFRECMKV